MNTIVAIDPSITSCGIAVWLVAPARPAAVATLKQPSDASAYQIRALNMVRAADAFLQTWLPLTEWSQLRLVMEVPNNWHSQRSADSLNAEAVQKLYVLTGMFLQWAIDRALGDVWVATPAQWKGTAPKHVMLARAQRLIANPTMSHDAAEALLLGRHGLNLPQPSHAGTQANNFTCVVGGYGGSRSGRGRAAIDTYVEHP